ncbi:MAG: hypothetical protein CMG55_06560 [Candidatus Marinimicrobia bacterium]|nr:hypothetical protein [Candidatus Neomarinimicrobiota bacterium]|tara:strand:+ start:1350 stop:1844 length:495 start_codon:yes stop_codon:yes gene_type:complete
MNYSIIPATKFDLDFILTLNQESLPAVSYLDLKKINYFLKVSSYFKIFQLDNKPVGFLIGLKPEIDYKSENYIWINQRYNSFIYVDRIIIDANYRNIGLGFYFYNHLIQSFYKIVKNIICEVNIRPYNKQSINFHKKYGFKEIGVQDTENGKKRVSYMIYKINL